LNELCAAAKKTGTSRTSRDYGKWAYIRWPSSIFGLPEPVVEIGAVADIFYWPQVIRSDYFEKPPAKLDASKLKSSVCRWRSGQCRWDYGSALQQMIKLYINGRKKKNQRKRIWQTADNTSVESCAQERPGK